MQHTNTNSLDKVAFLALTYSDFKCSYIWEKFFDPCYKNFFNLYIHNKRPLTSHLSEYCLSETVETSWGKFSLIEATFLLLEEAYKDESNQIFVLISDSHLPLHPMPEMHSKLQDIDVLDLNFIMHTEHEFFPIIAEFCKTEKPLFKHSQWITLTRKDVSIFLSTKEKYFKLFNQLIEEHEVERVIFDEFYFGTVANMENIPYTLHSKCHVNYFDANPKYLSDLGYHRKPFIYTNFNTKFFNYFAQKHLFLRKIYDDTRFVGDFWFNCDND